MKRKIKPSTKVRINRNNGQSLDGFLVRPLSVDFDSKTKVAKAIETFWHKNPEPAHVVIPNGEGKYDAVGVAVYWENGQVNDSGILELETPNTFSYDNFKGPGSYLRREVFPSGNKTPSALYRQYAK